MDRVGLEVRFNNSFHILSCAVVRVVTRSGFRDTPTTHCQPSGFSLMFTNIVHQRRKVYYVIVTTLSGVGYASVNEHKPLTVL